MPGSAFGIRHPGKNQGGFDAILGLDNLHFDLAYSHSKAWIKRGWCMDEAWIKHGKSVQHSNLTHTIDILEKY
jgi:hypothetical protein